MPRVRAVAQPKCAPGERRPRQEIEQRLADIGCSGAATQHLVFGKVRLKLDDVGAGFGRGVDQLRRQTHIAVMVDPGFRDDQTGMSRSNPRGCRS